MSVVLLTMTLDYLEMSTLISGLCLLLLTSLGRGTTKIVVVGVAEVVAEEVAVFLALYEAHF